MKRQAKGVDALFSDDEVRHPMWEAPGLCTYRHVAALRGQIARDLTPFDGRPNREFVTHFCSEVYGLTQHERTGDHLWLLGSIQVLRHNLVANRPLYRGDIAVITRMTASFTEAICSTLNERKS